MPGMLALAAPFALLAPLLAAGSSAGIANGEPAPRAQGHKLPPVETIGEQSVAPRLDPLNAWHRTEIARQVRIEQRVIIRIQPAPRPPRQSMLAELPTRQRVQQFEERQIGNCLTVSGIAGVQTDSGNRLLLFLRDQRIITLNLEKACRARDFYSGFYVERNADGQLCIDRDKLLSRNGAQCEIDRMRQLVAIAE